MTSNVSTECRRRKGSRHDKTGCLTCRYRRKKCTENMFPTCGTCLRLHLECIREPKRNVVPDTWADQSPGSAGHNTIGHSDLVVEFPSRLQPRYPPGLANSWSRQKRRVMSHYITVLTGHLTVSDQFNSFLSDILPMAMESVALSDAVAALASGHLALLDKSFELAALDAQTTAIHNLAASINAPSNRMSWYETHATTCLTFVISEIGIGDSRGYYNHLQGAKNTILSASTRTSSGANLRGPEAFKTSVEGQWILRNFAYHDIIGSVTFRRKPLLQAEYLNGITDAVDSSLGVATQLLIHLANLILLDEDSRFGQHPVGDELHEKDTRFQTSCASTEQQLLSWDCHSDASPGLAAAAYAFRNSVLIFLYQILRSRLRKQDSLRDIITVLHNVLQTKIRSQVESTLQHISEIPIGAAPESALLFPLFLAGTEAREAAWIDQVRQRLQDIFAKRRFQNISQALEILEDLWDVRKRSGGTNIDWTHILQASGKTLLLT